MNASDNNMFDDYDGAALYAMYCNAVGGTAFDDSPLLPWSLVPPRQRDGWVTAAKNFRRHVLLDD